MRHTSRCASPAAEVVRADREQPRVLALRAGVRLQRHRGEAGDLGEPGLELREHLVVALRLVGRGERVELAELRPRHRDHLGRGVELHRARAERDHRLREREVARLQPRHVAQHLGLGVVAVEDRVREERAPAGVGRRHRHLDLGRELLGGEGHRAARERLEEDGRAPPGAPSRRARCRPSRRRRARRLTPSPAPAPRSPWPWSVPLVRTRSVSKNGPVAGVEAEPAQAELQHAGERVDAARDREEALRPVVDRVHRRHDREQHLRRADVARGLLAADVLLAGLQREAVGRPALGVLRHADEAARQVPPVLVAHREERGVRPAVAHRHAEALGRAERDVGADLARRAQQRQREEVGRHHEEGALGVGARGEGRVVAHQAVRRRVLHEHAEDALRGEVHRLGRTDVDANAQRRRLGAHDRDRLRVAVLGHEERVPTRLRRSRGTGSSPRRPPWPRRGATRSRAAGR